MKTEEVVDILWYNELNRRRAHTIEENCGKLKVHEIPSQIQWKAVDGVRYCQDADRTELN